ncbi:MAG: hypothetical protein ACREA0_01045 [bacterium]
MRLVDLKRPRVYLPLTLAVLLAVVMAVVFHPGFQRKMLLDHVGPLVDSLEIEHVHLTPWSLGVKRLAVRYAGGAFKLGEGRIGFCLSSLVVKTISLQTVALGDFLLDLKEFQPPASEEPDTGPFSGVLALLDLGFGINLKEVLIDGKVLLGDEQSVVVKVTGGGIQTDSSGALDVAVRFIPGQEDDHVDVSGDVTIKQLAKGKYEALEADFKLQAVLAALPHPESMQIKARVSPAQPEGSKGRSGAPPSEADEPPIAREALELALTLNDDQARERSTVGLAGIYDGTSGQFVGEYRVTANERLVQPFLKDRTLPPTEELVGGDIDLDTAKLTGQMTVKSHLKLSDLRRTHANDRLPEGLSIKNDLRLSLLPGNELRVETLDSGVFDDAERKALSTRLPSDVEIRLDDIQGFLGQDRTLLELDLPHIPLTWFDVLLPDLDITGGVLQAAFEVTTDASAAIHLKPTRPFQVSGLGIKRGDEVLVEGLDLSALPLVTYTGKALRLSLNDVKVAVQGNTLASASSSAVISLADPKQTALTVKADADLYLDPVLGLLAPDTAGRRGLPKDLSLAFEGDLVQQADAIGVGALKASVSQGKQTQVLQVQLLKPLEIRVAEEGQGLRNAEGDLARITLGKLDLAWLSALVPGGSIKGALLSGVFSVAGKAGGSVLVATQSPIRVGGLSLVGQDGPVIEGLDITLKPELSYSTEGIKISYSDLRVKSRSGELVAATGAVTLPGAVGKRTAADGRVAIDLRALAEQPGIARALKGGIESPMRLEAEYGLEQTEDSVDIKRLAANLLYADGSPRVALTSAGGLRVRTTPGANANPLGGATGRVALDIRDLSPEPFAEALEANGWSFGKASGKASIVSDGATLNLDTVEPFVIEGIAVKENGKAVLRPFSIRLVPGATLRGETLRARIDEIDIAFADHDEKPAVKANAELSFKGGKASKLESLSARLLASLPDLLEQPALLPGHTLSSGEVQSDLKWHPSGRLQSSTKIQGLKGDEELALRAVEFSIDGQLGEGGAFAFAIPVKAQGKSGDTDIDVKVSHGGGEGDARGLRVDVDSKVVYLNDVLGTLRAIAGEKGEEDGEPEGSAPDRDAEPASSREADRRAVWDVLPYPTRLEVDVGRLFYTDYLEIRDIKGLLDLGPETLAWTEWAAYFHDSPMSVDGALRFSAGQASPYDLRLVGGIGQLNLAQFLRELAPGSTPRAEGLFDVKLDAFGRAPNLPQYRNDLFFDMRLQSRDGVFRPLEPDSVLITGSSNFAGAFGEGVSNVPTGLFGVGAVSRLVSYIREIPYDRIDIHVVRDESRDLQIKRYLVQSPSILMTAKGGIDYQAGKDVFESPMSLTVQLDMRKKGAAILHSLDLLKPEKDPYGYWVGPEIKVGGTFSKTQSNLEEIVTQAGSGAVMGGITRPVAGLWGNIKYDWFDEGEPAEYEEEK